MAIQINNTASLPVNQAQSTESQQLAGDETVSERANESSTVASISTENSETDREALEVSVSNINDFVQNIQRSIHFSIAENSGRTIIEVYDSETDELIRQIPSEDVQRISEAIAEQLREGLLFQTNI